MTDLNEANEEMNISAKEKEEEQNKKEEPICPKCRGNKRQFEFNCGHKLCFDCLLSFFISSNLSNLTLEELTFSCTICNGGGTFKIPVDEWSDILNQENEKQEERNRYMILKSQIPKKKCFNHKDQDVVGYCVNCKLWLCKECKTLFHNQYYPGHQFSTNEEVNIFCQAHPEEIAEYFCISCQKNICGLCTIDNGEIKNNHSSHRFITQIEYKQNTEKNNGQTSLKYQSYDQFEPYMEKYVNDFNEKLDNDFVKKKSKIDEMIQKLKGLEEEYEHQTENFKIKMNQIFNMIKLTYYLYFGRNERGNRVCACTWKKSICDNKYICMG